MLDAAVLAGGLRAAIRLREKTVVLAIDAAISSDPACTGALAADLALARALGLRPIVACEPGAGSGPLDAQGPALRLRAALDQHGERGALVPAAGLLTIHSIPLAQPGVPSMIPVVDTTILIHLSALGYIPILLPPAADAEGQPADAGAGLLAVFIAQFMSAALLVIPPAITPRDPAGIESGLPAVPPIVPLSPPAPGSLIADILLNAPDLPAAPEALPASANMVLP